MATKLKKTSTIVLRILALAATVIAVIFMTRSHDSAKVLNLTFTAKYSYSPALKYFVIVEAVVSGYSLIVLFLSPSSLLWRLIVILDMIATVLLTSSVSAALAIGEVGKRGNSHAGWLAVCGQVPKFCDQGTIAVIAGFAAAVIYFVHLLCSLHAILTPIFVVKP